MKTEIRSRKPEFQILKLVIIIILCLIATASKGQLITGTILDGTVDKPIPYAIVYINGSFVAAYSDIEGHFQLDVTGYSSMPLIISALGYNTLTITEIPIGKKLLIYLEPKVFELNEIVVSAKPNKKARAKNIKFFKSVFLGETYNAKRCEILNEDDIQLQITSNGDTLKVFASNPIIVKNNALGYTVTYFLDYFKYCFSDKLLKMRGNVLFKEDLSSKKSDNQMFEKRRIRAYNGSRMHFFRALYNRTLFEEGFRIDDIMEVVDYNNIGLSNIVNTEDQAKLLICRKKLPYGYKVLFVSNHLPSALVMVNDFVVFKKNGFFDGNSVIWEGEMAKQRIGDLLPYEYKAGI
jgi:hypothetical protein